MELIWYTPLDPGETDIARYSSRLLPHLSSLAHVASVRDGETDRSPDWWQMPSTASVEPRGEAPLPVYNIGNHPSHMPIWRQSLIEPGMVVLHDMSLVDLAKYMSQENGSPELWKTMLLQQYGEQVRELVNRSEKSPDDHSALVQAYPLFRPFIENAIGVVVHSKFARQRVIEAFPDGPPVIDLKLPAPPPDVITERDYSVGPLRFIFCGHVGPNRRLVQFFEAWGSLDNPARISLEIYGNTPNQRELLRFAQHFGVKDYVDFNGYVEESELEDALRSAHFALNLRWPTMGETSGSQLRYWSAGLPSIVTDVGWYSELADDAVCKISPERELEELHGLLATIVDDPGRYATVGLRGWEILSCEHSYPDYSQALVDFAQQCLERRLAHRTLDQWLVRTIASMCDEAGSASMFRGSIEAAVSAFQCPPESGVSQARAGVRRTSR